MAAGPLVPSFALDQSEYADGVDHRQGKSPPQIGADKPQPCEMNEGAAEQRDEETIPPGRLETQDADARASARYGIFPDRHQREQQRDRQEEQRAGERPGHPAAADQRREPVDGAILDRQCAVKREDRGDIDDDDEAERIEAAGTALPES